MKHSKQRLFDIYELAHTRKEYRNLIASLKMLEESFFREQESLNKIEEKLNKLVEMLESRK